SRGRSGAAQRWVTTEGEHSHLDRGAPSMFQPLSQTSSEAPFVERHIGPRDDEIAKMLDAVGYESLDALTDAAVPQAIRTIDDLDLPAASTEIEALGELRELARRNQRRTQMIGLGYYDTVTPAVVL